MQECYILIAVETLKAAIEQTSINITTSGKNFNIFYRSEYKIPSFIEFYVLFTFKSRM